MFTSVSPIVRGICELISPTTIWAISMACRSTDAPTR